MKLNLGAKMGQGIKNLMKKPKKLTKAELKAIEEEKQRKIRARGRIIVNATINQTRRLQSVSVKDLRSYFGKSINAETAYGLQTPEREVSPAAFQIKRNHSMQ